jgi:hypothetical protein
MNNNNEKSGNGNRINNNTGTQNENANTGRPNQMPDDKNTSDKKGTYIKDMPPIDGARPGVI